MLIDTQNRIDEQASEGSVRKLFYSTAIVASLAFASNAEAVEIFCPAGADSTPSAGERSFSVDTTSGPAAECFDSGSGNEVGLDLPAGYVLVDKEETGSVEASGLVLTGLGTTGGTFSFDVSLWSSFSNLIIVFKSGEGQADPDWAAFDLDPLTISGLWAIYNSGAGDQSLSHASLYGLPGTSVPDGGATLGLLGLGMLGIGYLRRRRQ